MRALEPSKADAFKAGYMAGFDNGRAMAPDLRAVVGGKKAARRALASGGEDAGG